MTTTTSPTGGATSGVPRDLNRQSTLQFAAERRAGLLSYALAADDADVEATELYQTRYVPFMDGEKPLSQKEWGEDMRRVPGVTASRIANGRWVYSGVTMDTVAERARSVVRRRLAAAALLARKDEPWVQLDSAHRAKHAALFADTLDHSAFNCAHELPPEVVAGRAEVDAEVDAKLDAAVAASEFGRYVRFDWHGPNPEWEAELARLEPQLPALRAARDAAEAHLRSFDPKPVIVPPGRSGLEWLLSGDAPTETPKQRASRLDAEAEAKAELKRTDDALSHVLGQVNEVRRVLALGALAPVSPSVAEDPFATY
jgi:hypothetical protein